jgi:hypothetical protein
MTCSSVTKQLNCQNVTYRSSHPNIWYLLDARGAETKNHPEPKIPTTRMIPLGQASPVDGMAGMAREGTGAAPAHQPDHPEPPARHRAMKGLAQFPGRTRLDNKHVTSPGRSWMRQMTRSRRLIITSGEWPGPA